MAQAPKTWILTGSPENFAATRERGFRLIGMKEHRRNQALDMERGDRIVFYLTQIGRFAGSALIAGEMFEDRAKVWPGKPGNPDPYPRLAFQGQLRTVSDADAALLLDRLRAAAGAPA